MRAACCQLEVVPGDPAGNLARSVDAARAALGHADLVLLPETCTSGLPFRDTDEAWATGLPDASPWAGLVGPGQVLVVGFAEQSAGDGRLYNSAALLDETGVRVVYRKTHLWNEEKLFFTPGAAAPPVVDTAVGRIGLMICYDMEFPELTRAAALAGAELLAVPTAWPVVPHPTDQPTFEVIVAQAAARVNRMAVLTCDRVGTTRGQEWTGGTVAVGPDGWVLDRRATAGELTVELDLTGVADKTLTPLAHLFGDRRPELYGPVTRA